MLRVNILLEILLSHFRLHDALYKECVNREVAIPVCNSGGQLLHNWAFQNFAIGEI